MYKVSSVAILDDETKIKKTKQEKLHMGPNCSKLIKIVDSCHLVSADDEVGVEVELEGADDVKLLKGKHSETCWGQMLKYFSLFIVISHVSLWLKLQAILHVLQHFNGFNLL